MNHDTISVPRDKGGLLAVGFGLTAAMWAVGYLSRIPPAIVPSWLLLGFMLVCLLGGGFVGGRYLSRGWQGGLFVCLIASALNLLILGSLLTGDQPNRVVPSALWWIPGSFLVATLAGAIGGAIGSREPAPGAVSINWRHAFACVLAGVTFLLLIIGGLVTSHEAGLAVVDWPNSFGYNMFLYPLSRMTGGIYYEHAHRLFGSLVGLTMLVFAIHLQITDRRTSVRLFAWLAFVLVVAQGLLGGLRVTGHLTLATSPEDTAPNIVLAMVHGTLGQVFFGMVIALVALTSTAWRTAPPAETKLGASTDHTLTVLLCLLLIAQIVLGTVLRHVANGLLVHITMAVVVVLLGSLVGLRAWGLHTGMVRRQRLGLRLVILLGCQIVLGIAAYIAAEITAGKLPRPAVDVIITTAHQITGAVLLAYAVLLMLWSHRLLKLPVVLEPAVAPPLAADQMPTT